MTTVSATVIADSVSSTDQIRLVTLQLRYPRWIHSELMTHRAFSRNASSSRAIPVERLIQDVIEDPAVPLFWGKNQRGMQASGEHDQGVKIPIPVVEEVPLGSEEDPTAAVDFQVGHASHEFSREEAWLYARDRAVDLARAFSQAGYHKQLVNRLLEPFSHINVVVTATEWDNFFALRRHGAAEPHLHLLADRIHEALIRSQPLVLRPGDWHLPYLSPQELEEVGSRLLGNEAAMALSAARCARVSYLSHEGVPPSLEDDLSLYDRLVGQDPIHASPTEHQATPDRLDEYAGPGHRLWRNHGLHGNFVGWCQHRKFIEKGLMIHGR